MLNNHYLDFHIGTDKSTRNANNIARYARFYFLKEVFVEHLDLEDLLNLLWKFLLLGELVMRDFSLIIIKQ